MTVLITFLMHLAGAAMAAAKLRGNCKQKFPIAIAKTAAIHHVPGE